MADELKLAELCEKADGPDRNLDAMIHGRNGPEGVGNWSDAPAFTASLDAAMTLATGLCCEVTIDLDGTAKAFIWQPGWTLAVEGHAANPALAVSAAALRAIDVLGDHSAIADRNAKRQDAKTGLARKGESGGAEGNRP